MKYKPMATPKLNLRILKLNCYTTGESGDDEVYLALSEKRIWPEKSKFKTIKSGATDVGIEIKDIDPGTSVELELWDYDFISRNDLIGHFKLYVDKQGGPFIAEMIKNVEESSVARYNLEWEIF